MLQLVRSLKRALATEVNMATKLQDLQDIITAHSGEDKDSSHSPHGPERTGANGGPAGASTVGGLFARRFRATARVAGVGTSAGGVAAAGAVALPESTQSVAVVTGEGEGSEGGTRQSGGGGFGDGPVLTLEELQRGMSLEVGNMSAITEEDGPHSNGDPYIG